MAGARKHMERSRKTLSKNYSQFRKTIRIGGTTSKNHIVSTVFNRMVDIFNYRDM